MTKKRIVDMDFSHAEERIMAWFIDRPTHPDFDLTTKVFEDAYREAFALPEEMLKGKEPE